MGRLTIRQPGRQYKNREFYAHAILTVTKRLIGKGVLYRPSFPRFFRIESPLISMRWALCAGNNSCYQPLGIGPGFGGHLRKLRFLFGCGMYFHDSSAGKPGVVLRSTRAFGARIMVPEIRALSERQIQFEWDEIKAAANERKHGITFEVASTVFRDPKLLTTADVARSETEDRWFSIGWASNGAILSVVHLWFESGAETAKVRLISARAATQSEIRQYTISSAYE